MRNPTLIDVADSSATGEVRRAAVDVATRLGFDEEDLARLAIVVTELSTNIVKHARSGLILIGIDEAADDVVQIVALDHGPGIHDLAAALKDGQSTTGTAGTGLGAVSRLSSFFQVYSQRTRGTAVVARLGKRGSKVGGSNIGSVSVPIRGEEVNGDGWTSKAANGSTTIMVVDGLGHGLPAHDAALAAEAAFNGTTGAPAEQLRRVHEGMQRTRGAALAIADLDPDRGTMLFAGVGNISATIVDPSSRRSAVSLHGIAGHAMREAREFSYPWSRESCLIMHSDGLTTRWDLDRYPGLIAHDAALIAAVLWNDHRRQNDDSTVVVVRTP